MITWPAMVPTDEDDRPEASSEMAKIQLAAEPSSGSSVRWASSMVPTLLCPPVWKVAAAMISMAALIRPANAHGDHDVDDLEAEEPAQLLRVPDDDAALRQRRVQEDDVRHDRGAQDAGGQQHALAPGELRHDARDTATCPQSGLPSTVSTR